MEPLINRSQARQKNFTNQRLKCVKNWTCNIRVIEFNIYLLEVSL